MPKGGARSNSGPAPDPNALARERDEGEWTVLPSTGRSGVAPKWPLPNPTARESQVWREHWKLPQALMWERLGQHHLVAIYVRRLVESETAGSRVNLGTLVRQMADGLGLTTPGLRSNRWRIEQPKAKAAAKSPAKRSTSRARLRVVANDAVEGTAGTG